MLFGYPLAAAADNWLHDCIVCMIREAVEALNEGRRPPAWPVIIPANHRQRLSRRRGLKSRFNDFIAVVEPLENDERARLLEQLDGQNDFPRMFDGVTPCQSCLALPDNVRDAIKDLMHFAFSLLSDLQLRDRHYEMIYDTIPSRVCPFCGCEPFVAPGGPRHPLDHYLSISRYPFAGANLRNLIPMGERCNTAYKGNQDILEGANSQRRRCFDPYDSTIASSVSVLQSRLFERNNGRLPAWVIDIGQSPEAATWDEVWSIRHRYANDVLDAEFWTWLGQLASWCRALNDYPSNRDEMIDVLGKFIDSAIPEGFAERAFLKRAVFEMLRQNVAVDDRLLLLMLDVANLHRRPPAVQP